MILSKSKEVKIGWSNYQHGQIRLNILRKTMAHKGLFANDGHDEF
jgi:hypothetical protein